MIINLTQHPATPDQIAAGVVDLPLELRAKVSALLTFEEIPDRITIWERAQALSDVAQGVVGHGPKVSVMIGGAPFLMGSLIAAIEGWGLDPVFAFSCRETREETLPDGSVRKTSVFRHAGFVPA